MFHNILYILQSQTHICFAKIDDKYNEKECSFFLIYSDILYQKFGEQNNRAELFLE